LPPLAAVTRDDAHNGRATSTLLVIVTFPSFDSLILNQHLFVGIDR
jgi:hypothetical protein